MEMKKFNFDLKYFLIILILVLICYLIYKNYFENKTLESFQQRNSLSTYYQQDAKDIEPLKHEYNYTENNFSINPNFWNGTYIFTDINQKMNYITFLQVNKKLLFIINLANYTIGGEDADPYVYSEDNISKECLPGMLIANGELNLNETIFYLKDVYCSNNNAGSGPFNPFGQPITSNTINLLYGYIDKENKNINLVQTNSDTQQQLYSVQLTKVENFKYGPSAEYLLRTSYNVAAPNVKNSIKINPDVCYNSTFGSYTDKGTLSNCYITGQGLPTPTEEENQNYSYNIYGTGCAVKSEIIEDENDGQTFKACPTNANSTCYIPITNNNGQQLDLSGTYDKCNTNFELNLKNQSSLMYPYYLKDKTTGNLMDICNYLEGFQSKKYNSVILMYVNNLSDVQSLHYDFFGIDKGENYLTTKLDIMFPYMNKNVLNKLRKNLGNTSDTSDTSDLEKSLQLTNCIQENETTSNFNSILTSCAASYNNINQQYQIFKANMLNNLDINKRKEMKFMQDVIENIDVKANQNKANRLLQPTVWQLEFLENNLTNENVPLYTNDCTFILSTSDKYTKESRFTKYAEFDSLHNKTSLNLYKGGNKQKLVLENAYVINSLEEEMGTSNYNSSGPNNNNDISNEFILLSGNLRTSQPKKYLIPGQSNQVGTFGNPLYLSDMPNPTGKWVLLGFNLTKNLDVGISSNSYNSTLIRTLKKISESMSGHFES